jgi:RHS repeat-associated protein
LGETGRTLGMHGWCSEAVRVIYAMAENNVVRFGTKRTEDGTGLVLYEYRAYSPALGRWLSRDPLGEQPGSFSLRSGPASLLGAQPYAFNAPVLRYDVLGLFLDIPPWWPPDRDPPPANSLRLSRRSYQELLEFTSGEGSVGRVCVGRWGDVGVIVQGHGIGGKRCQGWERDDSVGHDRSRAAPLQAW